MNQTSVNFFETQFQRQVREHDFVLNPFEALALNHLEGSVLDLGCGLGNLALEAARRGHEVVAVDASASAIRHIREQAALERLPVRAIEADVGTWTTDSSFDTIVCIGLLMFFPREQALKLLEVVQSRVRNGGRAVVNVLIEGTTFMRMFEPGQFHLFDPDEIVSRFRGWTSLLTRHDVRPAPDGTSKVFATLVAKRPATT